MLKFIVYLFVFNKFLPKFLRHPYNLTNLFKFILIDENGDGYLKNFSGFLNEDIGLGGIGLVFLFGMLCL